MGGLFAEVYVRRGSSNPETIIAAGDAVERLFKLRELAENSHESSATAIRGYVPGMDVDRFDPGNLDRAVFIIRILKRFDLTEEQYQKLLEDLRIDDSD